MCMIRLCYLFLFICFLDNELFIGRENDVYADSDERHISARQFATAHGLTDWLKALDIIAMGSPEQVHCFLDLTTTLISIME